MKCGLAIAAKIRASDVRQQKHDKRDARLLLQLLPSREQKDLRQLLIHRHKLVRIRAQVKNGLQHLAMNQGVHPEIVHVESSFRVPLVSGS